MSYLAAVKLHLWCSFTPLQSLLRAFSLLYERQEGNDIRYVQNFAGEHEPGSNAGALAARSEKLLGFLIVCSVQRAERA
jgi:hypothetical protein